MPRHLSKPLGLATRHRVSTSESHGRHEREHYWSEKEGMEKGEWCGRGGVAAGGAKRAYQTTPVAK